MPRPPLLAFLIPLLVLAAPTVESKGEVGPVPGELRDRLKLDPFYQKHLDVDGLPVLGSAKVSDDALAEAGWIVRRMLGNRPDILKAMASQNVRAVVMAADEYTTDVPEHSGMRPKLYWDRRARGLGATPHTPVVSGAEENLLSFRHDPYPNENIFLHEFAHAIHGTGLNKVDPTFDARLRTVHRSALDRGLWKNTYAAGDHHEYWAEGVQSWFDDNAPPDALHNDVRTRERLKAYDPDLAALCLEVFGDGPWRYVKPRDRAPEDPAHLTNYNPTNVPQFHWRWVEPGERTQVAMQTAVGDFQVELNVGANPAAARAFLKIALDGGYHSGAFTRISKGAVWGSASRRWKQEWAQELKLPPFPAAPAARPRNGDVALVREGADWFGLALFLEDDADVETAEILPIGRIAKGREVVQKILDAPAHEGVLNAPVEIRRVIRED